MAEQFSFFTFSLLARTFPKFRRFRLADIQMKNSTLIKENGINFKKQIKTKFLMKIKYRNMQQ